MKFKLGIIALGLGLVVGARAQSSHGYGFVGVGGATANGYTSAMLGFGLGGEVRIVRMWASKRRCAIMYIPGSIRFTIGACART